MSILRYKQKLLADGGVARGGDGGGGGGAPTTSTAYNTNVPEYARPYVENMLQSTQKQIYNDDMTSFRPYQPYSQDVNNYFAGYSPMQKQAQYETANMQTPGQFGVATGLTGLGAMGSMGAGANYANNVTNPSTMQAYMNPYQQGVTDVAKNAAVREAMMAENANKLSSARQGTYGGARQLLGSTERERNLLSNLSNIQAQGSNQAYNQALQSQQFGANLGLQGYGQAIQGAGQLASIGGQQQAADLARIGAQNQMGAGQQAFEQQKVNQAISNYATAQQYPFMQLGIMNSMLRGLPLQQTTTSTYQQQPSTTQQLAGLGGAGLSYFGGGRREGGIIGMKEGGTVPGYKYGDLISDPQLQGMSQNLSPQQLQGRIADQQVTPNERGIFQGTQQAQNRLASNPMAAPQMAQMAAPPPQMAQAPSDDARMGGIAAAGGDMFNTMGYAGGGIIAFAGEGPSLVKDLPDMSAEEYGKYISDVMSSDIPIDRKKRIAPMLGDALSQLTKKENPTQETKTEPTKTAFKGAAKDAVTPAANTREAMYAQTQAMLEKQGFKPGATPEEEAYNQMLMKQQAGSGNVTSAQERANMAKAFLKMGANPRGFLPGAIEGAESYITGAGEIAAKAETRETALAESRAKYAAAQRARAVGDIAASDKLTHEAEQLKNQANIAAGNNAATIRAAEIHAGAAGQPAKLEKEAIEQYMKEGLTYTQAYEKVKQAGRSDTNEIARMRYADAVLADDMKYQQLITSKKPEDQEKAKQIRDTVYKRYGVTQGGSNPVAAAPVQNEDGTVTIPGKGTFKKLPNGNYAPV
jgi:hypothetical protein